jgi:hypothetical protein
MKKLWDSLKRILKWVMWIVLGAIFLYPFYTLFFSWVFGRSFGPLYTFGLELKDFLTVWVALGGIVGVVSNVILSRKRIDKQEEQFNKQQREARFASGVELLGNPHESTRIGGAYTLYFLARDFEEFRAPVCEILCAHLRSIARKDKFETDEQRKNYPRNEVQSIIDLLLLKHKNGISIFLNEPKNFKGILFWGINANQTTDFIPTLKKVDFTGATLIGVLFSGSVLTEVRFFGIALTDVNFSKATLTNVYFIEATLTKVGFERATLAIVIYFEATLREVDFRRATLTRVDFGKAVLTEYTVNFGGTKLEGYSDEEITREGHSLKLTADEEK